jgi:hypothetical protein
VERRGICNRKWQVILRLGVAGRTKIARGVELSKEWEGRNWEKEQDDRENMSAKKGRRALAAMGPWPSSITCLCFSAVLGMEPGLGSTSACSLTFVTLGYFKVLLSSLPILSI